MGSHITKEQAKKMIVDTVEKYTKDYELYLAKRKVKNRISKTLVYGLKVKEDENNEDLFDDLVKLEVSGNDVGVVESEMILENRKNKELFLIKADVMIYDTNDIE